jgi:D-alanine-D-alanine ligase
LRIFERYRQPAIVESFLPGAEITAGIVGNDSDARLLGMMKISERKLSDDGVFLYSLEHKRDWQERILYEGPEALDEKVRREAATIALDAFHALELRDIARIDMRMDGQGQLRVIDINPLPGLSPYYSDLPILYSLSGGNYHYLISQILRSAFNRYGLLWLEG